MKYPLNRVKLQNTFGVRGLLCSGIVLPLILVTGCEKARPPAAEEMQKLGCLAVSNTNVLEGRFWVRKGYRPVLGLTILDSDPYDLSQVISLDRVATKLRISVDLFETNVSSSFYTATVLLDKNMAMCRRWPTNWGASICGIEPLPCYWPHTNSGWSAVYRKGRDVFPLQNAQLTANRTYGLRIAVLDPTPMTNQVCFWIYLARPNTWLSKTYNKVRRRLEERF